MAVQSGLCLVCIGPGRKPRRPGFPQQGSYCISVLALWSDGTCLFSIHFPYFATFTFDQHLYETFLRQGQIVAIIIMITCQCNVHPLHSLLYSKSEVYRCIRFSYLCEYDRGNSLGPPQCTRLTYTHNQCVEQREGKYNLFSSENNQFYRHKKSQCIA